MTPLESIAKHLTDHSAIEESKYEENVNSETTSSSLTRYHEISLDDENEKDGDLDLDKNLETYSDLNGEDDRAEENVTVPLNHKIDVDQDYVNMEKYEIDQKTTVQSVKNNCKDCDNNSPITINSPKPKANISIDLSKDIDTIEGFQRFSEGLLRSK